MNYRSKPLERLGWAAQVMLERTRSSADQKRGGGRGDWGAGGGEARRLAERVHRPSAAGLLSPAATVSDRSLRSLSDSFRARAREANKQNRERLERARSKARLDGESPRAISWDELDKHSGFDWDPDSDLTKRLADFLANNTARNRSYRRLAQKLGGLFGSYYTQYRRQAERRLQSRSSSYTVPEAHQKYADECAIQLVLRGVTPRELLSYWHRNIGQFTTDLALPPLHFLKSGANVDRVLQAKLSRKKPLRDNTIRPPVTRSTGNTFSDADAIDERLRPALTDAGFNLQKCNNRFLLSVQHNAIATARGREVFLPKGPMRDMAKWAARNLYAVDSRR